jgi:hypothetical protein
MLASPIVLYSPIMIDESRRKRIARVARALRGWRLDGLAATLLAEGGPLPFLGAQALYFGAPLLGALAPAADLDGLAGLLEDPEAVRVLAQQLAEAA